MLSRKGVGDGCEVRPLQAAGTGITGAESLSLVSRVPEVQHTLRIGGNLSWGLGARERATKPLNPFLHPNERSSRPLGLLAFLKLLRRPAAGGRYSLLNC